MRTINRTIRTITVYIFALVLSVSMPLSVMAEGEIITSPTEDPAPSSSPDSEPVRTYTYDESTGRWNTDQWYYDSTTGTYQAIPQPVEPLPTITTEEKPLAEDLQAEPLIIDPITGEGIISNETDLEKTIDSTTTSDILNEIDSLAQSGDATVISNTLADDATSGDASAVATIVNNISSVLSLGDNQKAAEFTADITGDVNGDILLQPMLLKTLLESGSAPSTEVNVNNDNTITNDINLEAISGNAGVIGNTTAGDATSGSADTVANVVNIINSLVAANESFIGTVNIYGNLNGDILIAPDFIPQLIASNGVIEGDESTKLSIDSTDMQSVINNVSLAAESGKAVVANNTNAGDAISGDAKTNVVIFNLSGHEIVASNSLLVFVNVLGQWVGVIVDAPVGATAAAIGNGVTTDDYVVPDLTIVSNNTNQITNNINLLSLTGNATVASNTNAGNAITGNATASANIANIAGSQFGLSGWFGILFINVFGTWHGSFGLNTAYGDPIINNNPSPDVTESPTTRVIEFIPSVPQDAPEITLISRNSGNEFSVINTQDDSTDDVAILGSKATGNNGIGAVFLNELPTRSVNLALIAGTIFLLIISAAGLNQIRLMRRANL
ncbi:MAG: hypothetical protein WA087_02540 [Candidatus Saccharimonadales bacterium]